MNFNKFLKEKHSQGKDLEDVKSYLYKNYIKTVVEDNADNTKRVMFISNRRKSDFENPLSAEANGIITEYNENTKEWKILMVPTFNFNSSYLKMNDIQYFYNQNLYTVYKVYDGTIINLYYYNEKWRISTNKGYDVSDLNFNYEFSYKEILLNILKKYPEFDFSKLNKNKTYTLCVKYDKFHLFNEIDNDNNYVVLIQSVDLNSYVINTGESIGLPNQEILTDLSFQKLCELKKKAHDNYKQYLNNNSKKYEHIYGFILKSNDFSTTTKYSYIYLESSLMKNIRNLIYNYNYFPTNIKKNDITNYNIILLNIIKNIIVNNNDNIYKVYFPKYSIKYDEVKKFLLNDLSSHIISNIENLYKLLPEIHSIKNDTLKINCETNNFYINQYNIEKVNKLALLIYNYVYENMIDINIPEGKSILVDLNNMKYIIEYYHCLSKLFK